MSRFIALKIFVIYCLSFKNNVWFQKISILPATDGQWKFLRGGGAKG